MPVEASSLAYARQFVPVETFILTRYRGGGAFRSSDGVVAYLIPEPLWRRGTRRFVVAFVGSVLLFGGTLVAAIGPYPTINTAARVCLPVTLLLAGVLAWRLSSRVYEFRPAGAESPTLRVVARQALKRNGFDILPASTEPDTRPLAVVVEIGGMIGRRWSLRAADPSLDPLDTPELATFIVPFAVVHLGAPPQELRLFASPDARGRLTSKAFIGVELALDFRPADDPRLPRDHLLILAFLAAWNGG